MKKLWKTIKNNPETTGYFVLALLLFGACFRVEFSFIAAFYIFIFAFFLHNECKILGLILFICPFDLILGLVSFGLFSGESENLSQSYFMNDFIMMGLSLIILILYIHRLLKKEKKINLKIFVPLSLFLVYMALPFHKVNWNDWVYIFLLYLSLYVIFEERDEMDFPYLFRLLFIGIMLSCVYSLYYKFSPLLVEHINFVTEGSSEKRFQGLTNHSLWFTLLITLVISSLLILKYKKKISMSVFFVLFIPAFIFGYLTIARAFIVIVLVSFALYIILYNIKYRTSSLFFIVVSSVIVLIISLIFIDITKSFFVRFSDPYKYKSLIDEFLDGNYDKEILNNLNVILPRIDIFKFYFFDWLTSLRTIFFGHGISYPLILDKFNSHNFVLHKLWEHGIIGCVFYIVIFIMMINWKKIKEVKKYIPALICIIPFLLYLMIELNWFVYIGFSLTFVIIGWLDKEEKEEIIIEDELLKKIRLSIIVPVYNGEKFIKRCIDKILQIKLEKEIIVIDDGSTDNSLELLKEYKEQIILINLKENKGVSHARNLGLEKATGDYISFIDIDDDFELDMHSKIITKMLKENADVGMCNFNIVDNNNLEIQKPYKNLNYENISQNETVRLHLRDKLVTSVWSTVYRKKIVSEVRFIEDIHIEEDRLFQLSVALRVNKTIFINHDLYHYKQNISSITLSNSFIDKNLNHENLFGYLNENELHILKKDFSDDFEYAKKRNDVIMFCMYVRWILYDKKYVNKVKKDLHILCEKIIKIKNCEFSIRLKAWLMIFFGIEFYIFITKILNKIKLFINKHSL